MSSDRNVELPSPLEPGQIRVVQAGDKPVACFGRAGGTAAFEDFCPHRGGPLSEGEWDGDSVTCPWHGARFSLETGEQLAGPPCRPLKKVAVRYVERGGEENSF